MCFLNLPFYNNIYNLFLNFILLNPTDCHLIGESRIGGNSSLSRHWNVLTHVINYQQRLPLHMREIILKFHT